MLLGRKRKEKPAKNSSKFKAISSCTCCQKNVSEIQGSLRVVSSNHRYEVHPIGGEIVENHHGCTWKFQTSDYCQKNAGDIQGSLRAICLRWVKKSHQIFSDFQTVCQKSSFVVMIYKRTRKALEQSAQGESRSFVKSSLWRSPNRWWNRKLSERCPWIQEPYKRVKKSRRIFSDFKTFVIHHSLLHPKRWWNRRKSPWIRVKKSHRILSDFKTFVILH